MDLQLTGKNVLVTGPITPAGTREELR